MKYGPWEDRDLYSAGSLLCEAFTSSFSPASCRHLHGWGPQCPWPDFRWIQTQFNFHRRCRIKLMTVLSLEKKDGQNKLKTLPISVLYQRFILPREYFLEDQWVRASQPDVSWLQFTMVGAPLDWDIWTGSWAARVPSTQPGHSHTLISIQHKTHFLSVPHAPMWQDHAGLESFLPASPFHAWPHTTGNTASSL